MGGSSVYLPIAIGCWEGETSRCWGVRETSSSACTHNSVVALEVLNIKLYICDQ